MVSALFASLFVLLGDIFDMVTIRFTVTGALLSVSDALLCACAVYFYTRSFSVPLMKTGIRKLSNYDAVCLCITAASLLCCVGKINISGVYPFHIAACMLIIFCAYYGRVPGGTISGVMLGIVLSFGCEMPQLFYMYAAGGLLAGAFSFLGQYACAAVFAVSACVAAFVAQVQEDSLLPIAECVFSSVVFMLIPRKKLSGAEEYLTKSGLRNDNEINMQVALNLRTAAKTVGSIGDVVSEVSRKMQSVVSPEVSRTYARIQHNVCTGCKNQSVCWEDSFSSTIKDVQQIAQLRLNCRKVRPELLTGGLAQRCTKIKKLADEIDKDYKQFVTTVDSRLKIDEMRSVVTDQFSSMAQLLSDISEYLADEKIYDENRSRALRQALRENRISAVSVTYRENSFSRATVEIALSEEPSSVNTAKIKKIISSELKKKFDEAEVSVEDLMTILVFRQRAQYEAVTGIKQISCGDNQQCGDCAQTFDAQEGCTVAVISDGMGTGRRAALDAAMTSTIMNRLLSSGFTFRSALRLVNSALLIKSGEESLSTVDALCINPFNAVCTFYKAGANASYVRHGGEIYKIEKPSLPVGILRNIDFAQEECEMGDGDIVLMMSDGANGSDSKWLEDTLRCWSTDNMQELATHIASMARMKNEKDFPDDISVIAVRIAKI